MKNYIAGFAGWRLVDREIRTQRFFEELQVGIAVLRFWNIEAEEASAEIAEKISG